MHGLAGVRIPKQVTVLGTGASGCWAAFFAALSGVQEMLLLDASDVSDDDMGRTIFRPRDVGRPKAEATAEIISMFRPAVKARPVKRSVQPSDQDIYFGAVLFDGVDDKQLNAVLPAEAKKRNMIYTLGFFGGLGAGVTNEHFEDLNWTRGGETPVWPASAAFSGILQCYSAFVGQFSYFGNPTQHSMPTEAIVKRLKAAGPKLKLAL
ncbi:MAG TPA: ThiF family adenylyltransferase [Rhizomicrobium sp.]|nr:ThiF family adenylyltransferase [Rhizomicrobium sp.]